MPVNFQTLQGIQAPKAIATLPEEAPSSGGGIGGIFKALAGVVGGMTKKAPGAEIGATKGAQGFGVGNVQQDAGGFQNAGGSYGGQSRVPGLQAQGAGGINHSYDSITKQFLGKTEVGDTKALSGFFQQSLGVNIDPRNVPWCGAFAGSVIQSSGYAAPKNPLAARSYLNFGQPTDQPKIGDLVVLGRGPGLGHVGFYNGLDAQGRPTMLSGNHDNGVGIGTFDTSKVLGYRTAPTAQELQSKPSPMAMTQQATQRAFNDPTYAAKIVKEHSMISPSQMVAGPAQGTQLSNMAGTQPMNQQSNNPLAIPNVRSSAQQIYQDNPVMADIATAQAILESRLNGKPSGLAANNNNLFGIKGQGTAGSVNMQTKEQGKNGLYSTNAGFAKNATLADSFTQHQKLMQNPRYKGVIGASSFEEAAQALQDAGYATDPTYAKQLIGIYNSQLKGGGGSEYANNSGTMGSQSVQAALGQPQQAAPAPIPVQAPPQPAQQQNSMAQRAVQGLRNFTGALPQQPEANSLGAPSSITGVRGEAGQGVNWGLLQALIQQQQKEQA